MELFPAIDLIGGAVPFAGNCIAGICNADIGKFLKL